MSAFAEKEMLRRRYEQQDTGAAPPPMSPPTAGGAPPTLLRAHQWSTASPYPSPPPSNGFHQPAGGIPNYASIPPPPPLAPKPPREYIEETRAEDVRTAAKISAIDSSPTSRLADGDSDEEEPFDAERCDQEDSTFGPGTLSLITGNGNGIGSKPSSPGPGLPSRSSTMSTGTPGIPNRPPLPPKVLIE
ncbi:uncharacterized protein BXZ73DRAFT_95308 [Epithele typhae]|uniref:uncharacterized protein n=1 Tax=Epithele typhae TaxID=378194 RepID=UPI0020073ED6|nr:uncharacterized protein BXZ73DRAFT_95308 [Epithele typhae]KAH9945784.1 hypothetical protein BXZ73DRAFT_95308 [Epithele typhae]